MCLPVVFLSHLHVISLCTSLSLLYPCRISHRGKHRIYYAFALNLNPTFTPSCRAWFPHGLVGQVVLFFYWFSLVKENIQQWQKQINWEVSFSNQEKSHLKHSSCLCSACWRAAGKDPLLVGYPVGQSQVQSPAQVRDPRGSSFQYFQASCAPQKAGCSVWEPVYRCVETIVGSTRDALEMNLQIMQMAGSCVRFLSS